MLQLSWRGSEALRGLLLQGGDSVEAYCQQYRVPLDPGGCSSVTTAQDQTR